MKTKKKTKTYTKDEYTIFGSTAKGGWRRLIPLRYFGTREEAQAVLDRHISMNLIPRCEAYKIMKRRVISTFSEWEDIDTEKKDGGAQ